jgi:hypothetical protein
MSTEGLPRYDEDIAEEYSFDELAKGMASGAISRGRALKLVGASLLGLGTLGCSEALLRPRSGAAGEARLDAKLPPNRVVAGTVGLLLIRSYAASQRCATEPSPTA